MSVSIKDAFPDDHSYFLCKVSVIDYLPKADICWCWVQSEFSRLRVYLSPSLGQSTAYKYQTEQTKVSQCFCIVVQETSEDSPCDKNLPC